MRGVMSTRPRAAAIAAFAACALCAPALHAGPKLRYVVAPLVAQVEAKPREAARTTRELRRALGKQAGVRVVALPKGFIHEGPCEVECLSRLLELSGADRAVGGTLTQQAKVHYPGILWTIALEQVDRARAGPWGRYERVHVSARSQRRFLVAASRALVSAAPDQRLPPMGPPPSPPPDVPELPGMAYVPAGDFVMGSDYGEPDEQPRHLVYLDAFYVDLYETSNAEYAECVAAGACRRSRFHRDPDLGRPRHPVCGIDFADVSAYCAWRGKRLPTEAEWERAARGTREVRWPWGDVFDPQKVNMRNPDDGWPTSAPVDAFPAGRSPVGAYQMAGNVWEWTQDWDGPDYYRTSPRRNPKGPKSAPRKVIRGGSWRYDIPFFVSAHNRSDARVGSRFRHVGVRCFKDAMQARAAPP